MRLESAWLIDEDDDDIDDHDDDNDCDDEDDDDEDDDEDDEHIKWCPNYFEEGTTFHHPTQRQCGQREGHVWCWQAWKQSANGT